MTPITLEQLAAVRDRESLFAFLRDALDWPTDDADTFTYPLNVAGAPTVNADVTQIVPFTGDDPYRIYLVGTNAPIRRRDLRESLRLVRAHLRQTGRIGDTTTDRLLFMCAGPSYEELRFVRFTQQEGRQPRICSFGWEHARAGETRTVREMCLPKLRLGRDLFDAIQWDTALWEQAWDVEAVTREFFRGYHQVFDQLKLAVGKSVPDDGAAHLFTQRLLNRIMFCWFLQRRDWLNKQQDYLRALYEIAEDHRRSGGHGPRRPNYYRDYLWPLFFCALNTPWDARPCDDEWSLLSGVLGNVPYLNGGLFAPEEPLDSCDAVKLPNVAFEPVLSLFERFHFTITESTPDDTEVAVDPEMLGKVFEELITERHEKGSYYTPRPIVSFMCREAIKGYLNAHHELVDERRADAITVPEARELLERLAAIRVVDPACGSGAYLLGMLHELHDLTRLLDTRAQRADARGDYHRKLDIICNSIYGVDLDPFAVNIARLRLWLSLVVEFEGDNPPPLPNLDFKIEQGDSLLEPAQSGSSIRADIVAEYAQAKADYTRGPDSGDREHLAARVASLRGEIAHWHARGTAVFGLDWLVEFAEVAQRGGFDVVVANPPYVRQEELTTPCWQVLGVPKPEETAVPRGAGNPLLMPYKRALAATHGDVATGTADLYCYFYSRAVQLLKPGGVLAFISSNKWFRAKYGEKLRAYLADHCFTLSITDFGELPVFDAGTFPMIYIARRRTEAEMTAGTPSEPVFTQVKSLDPPYPDVAALIERDGQPLPPNAINKKVWLLTGASEAARIKKMEQAGVPLGVYVRNRIYYGIKTGFNEAFIIDQKKRDELIAADPKSAEIIKPLAVGDDIRRWHIRDKKRWLIFTRRGTSISRYPAIEKHLRQWRDRLTPKEFVGQPGPGRKPGDYKWFEMQDTVAYYDVFERPKIIYPEMAMTPRFTLDESGLYPNKTAFSIPGDDRYLLAILNSASAWWYLKSPACCSVLGDENKRGRLLLQEVFVGKLPLPDASDAVRSRLADLAQKCLAAQGQGCEAWEREIDEIVAGLYGL